MNCTKIVLITMLVMGEIFNLLLILSTFLIKAIKMSRLVITLTSIVLSCFVTSSYGMDDLTEKEKIILQKKEQFKSEMVGKNIDELEKKRQELQIENEKINQKRNRENNFSVCKADEARLKLNMECAQIISRLAENFYK